MRKFIFICFIVLLVINPIFASNPKLITAESPVLITSFGQNPDTNFVKLLGGRIKLKSTYLISAAPDKVDWKTHRSLIGVIGGSGKGLGAAGLDIPSELVRCRQLISDARKAKATVIGMHIGGEDRRGPNSEPFLPLAAEVDYMIVKSNGNQDGYFTKLCKEHNIPLYIVETTGEIQNVLKEIFM